MEYTVPKKKFSKNSIIDRMEIRFSNGDYLTIRKNEICDISITFYDRLIKHERDFFAVGHSGFIKLKIQSGKAKSEDRKLHNPQEYVKNRKEYIENRCTTENYIESIVLYNQLNWSDQIFGDLYATLENGYLYVKFNPNTRYGTHESENHTVNIAPITEDVIFKMNLDFENCDEVDVYNSEIKEMNLEFEKELEWNSSGYVRTIKKGYLKIKFDQYYTGRYLSVYCEDKDEATLEDAEERICDKGISPIDICHLYIEYYRHIPHTGEAIQIDSLAYKAQDEDISTKIDDYGDYDKEDEFYVDEDNEYYNDDYEPYVSGYAEKQQDGSILIFFGESLEDKNS